MKKCKLPFTLIGIMFFSFLTFIIIQEFQYSNQFSKTKLEVTIDELKENWGNPDVDFVYKDSSNDRILKYKTLSGIGKYLFKFDKNTGLLILKYDDSF